MEFTNKFKHVELQLIIKHMLLVDLKVLVLVWELSHYLEEEEDTDIHKSKKSPKKPQKKTKNKSNEKIFE